MSDAISVREARATVITNEEARTIANLAISYFDAHGNWCCNRHNDIHPDDVYAALERAVNEVREAHDYSTSPEIPSPLWAALWKRAAIRYREIALRYSLAATPEADRE